MLQIPKNVMQIGEINPHTKIYMEDYVHTFLENEKGTETYLVFGKKEERDDIFYYMIYGVEKKTDWDRGCFPYFKKQERIGTVEGAQGSRVFKPIRGAGMMLDSYFIFYEQNEDMQSYMIATRETAAGDGSEEKEKVMEAMRARQEMSRKKEEQQKPKPTVRQTMRRVRRTFRPGQRIPSFKRNGENKGWRFSDFCRAGSLVLVLLLLVLGLTSLNRYPDMKAVTGMFADAAKAVMGEKSAADGTEESNAWMIVEEEASEVLEFADVDEGEMLKFADEEEVETRAFADVEEAETRAFADGNEMDTLEFADADGTAVQMSAEGVKSESPEPVESPDPEEDEAEQAIARPVSYVVKKGDSLAGIARKFYGSASMVKEICKVNEIKDPDQIHAGQNILLP